MRTKLNTKINLNKFWRDEIEKKIKIQKASKGKQRVIKRMKVKTYRNINWRIQLFFGWTAWISRPK
jgi:ferredoxin-like protein FixX